MDLQSCRRGQYYNLFGRAVLRCGEEDEMRRWEDLLEQHKHCPHPNTAPIDRRCAHEVLEYKCGTRPLAVFYTMDGYEGTDDGVKRVLTDSSLPRPSDLRISAMLAAGHHQLEGTSSVVVGQCV